MNGLYKVHLNFLRDLTVVVLLRNLIDLRRNTCQQYRMKTGLI